MRKRRLKCSDRRNVSINTSEAARPAISPRRVIVARQPKRRVTVACVAEAQDSRNWPDARLGSPLYFSEQGVSNEMFGSANVGGTEVKPSAENVQYVSVCGHAQREFFSPIRKQANTVLLPRLLTRSDSFGSCLIRRSETADTDSKGARPLAPRHRSN